MSTTQFSFKAKVKIGDQIVPLASQVVIGDSEAQSGIDNGFLFKLDRQTGDPPVQINLGDMINFVEQKLGGGDLSSNPQVATLQQIFPMAISSSDPFNSSNSAIVNIESFEINSTTKEFLFKISINIEGSNPDAGLITFPNEFSSWLKIENLAISFTANKKNES